MAHQLVTVADLPHDLRPPDREQRVTTFGLPWVVFRWRTAQPGRWDAVVVLDIAPFPVYVPKAPVAFPENLPWQLHTRAVLAVVLRRADLSEPRAERSLRAGPAAAGVR